MIVDDIEDVNEHLLGLALIRTMQTPGAGVTFPEVAVTLIEAIKTEGWVSSEARDHAERQRDAAGQEILEQQKVIAEKDEEILKLQKQIAVLISSLGSSITTTVGPGVGTYTSPSTPWVTHSTTTTSSAVSAAEVASQYMKQRRLSS